jgi:hypothetical protein
VVVGFLANLWLITSLGVIGAAFGILLPYLLLGVLRHRTLRLVFGWERPWHNIAPPLLAAMLAAVPAVICRLLLHGIASEILSAAVFLLLFGLQWWIHLRATRKAAR